MNPKPPGKTEFALAALLAVVLLAALPLGAQVTVQVPDTTSNGAPVSLPVSLVGAGTPGIVAVEVFVTYDPLKLNFTGMQTAGTLSEPWVLDSGYLDKNEVSGPTLDTLKIAGATVSDTIKTSGVFVVLNFSFAGLTPAETAPLTLQHVLLNAGSPAAVPDHGSVKFAGKDGSIAVSPTLLSRNENIQVTVVDPDEDSSAGADSVLVRATNAGQSETFYAVGSDSTFTGAIAAVFTAGATPSGDGILQVRPGDLVSICFDDSLDAQGNLVERCASVTADNGTLGAVDVTVVVEPTDTLRIRLQDADLNSSAGAADTASVVVTNSSTQETATILLTETGPDTDTFFGLAFTAFGTGAGPDTDAELNVQRTDSLFVAYADAATGQGTPKSVRDTCVVVDPWGDASGNNQLRGFDAAEILSHVVGSKTLVGLDSLAANLDSLAPHGEITSFDASLVLQKRVGLIGHFPVQEKSSNNHPQPESGSAAPKPLVVERLLSLVAGAEYLALVAEERDGIVSGELFFADFEGEVRAGEGMDGFMVAARHAGSGTRVALAGSRPASGRGELLRLFPAPGQRVRLREARFNDGRILGREGWMAAESRPSFYALHPNAPNPFNPETLIRFDLPREAEVRLDIYNVAGQRVRTLVRESRPAGSHQALWDGRDEGGEGVGAGVYFYRLQAGEYQAVHRMVLVK